jgi:hypothetical protein
MQLSRPVSELDISIDPMQVRLITTKDDLYTWKTLPDKQHLFKKHLSKPSIGAYREHCREVGVSFEALSVDKSNHGDNLTDWNPTTMVHGHWHFSESN